MHFGADGALVVGLWGIDGGEGAGTKVGGAAAFAGGSAWAWLS